MANWDFVFPYDSRAADWLAEQDLPHPAVLPRNRLPCTREVISAWRYFDHQQAVLIDDFDWDDDTFVPTDAFKLRGDLVLELRILTRLAETCGQLWRYPDTGAPAIVVDSTLDPERTSTLLAEAAHMEDSWVAFYRLMYAS